VFGDPDDPDELEFNPFRESLKENVAKFLALDPYSMMSNNSRLSRRQSRRGGLPRSNMIYGPILKKTTLSCSERLRVLARQLNHLNELHVTVTCNRSSCTDMNEATNETVGSKGGAGMVMIFSAGSTGGAPRCLQPCNDQLNASDC
jgi:hypothetical protein